ncbi:D-2-hydroxyacid dehydrogenase [Bacteroidota bacterium]
MKIVVLDAYTTNPGDLSWSELEKLGECYIYDRTSTEQLYERCINAEIILTNKTVLNKNFFEKLPEVKYVGLLSTGYDVVDINAASKRNIVVTNVPAYGTDSVAQTVFAHLLNLTHHVYEHSLTVSEGDWSSIKDFTYQNFPLIELAGKTMGIIGFGRIGQKVAEISNAFGMNVIFFTEPAPEKIPDDCKMCSLEELFKSSTVISLHCPLTENTKHIINEKSLEMMKNDAFLINTSRGPLIDEPALVKALNSGIIGGAGLDVLDQEPPSEENPLFRAKNCFITPHYSWATMDSRKRLINKVINNVEAFIHGNVKNKVN